tara:strand:- start:2327 stop:3100 length:774 start_codon:yes stop_codon:yes gene_type:complete
MSVKFTILGCGSSLGIPRIDGYFGKCDPKNKKNIRTRCSALISSTNMKILIDTSPDIKTQLIKNKITNIDKVFYTHHHADQTHGINELRVFYLKHGVKVPLYADKITKKYLLSSFKYCFKNTKLYPATLSINNLKKRHVFRDGNNIVDLKSFSVQHGPIDSICYLVNNRCVYASDISKINKNEMKYFKNLKYLVVDCLRYKSHPSHFNLDDVLKLVSIIKPKKTILTNMNNDVDYSYIKNMLPNNIVPAYDGLSFSI